MRTMDEETDSANAEYHLLFVQPQELSYDELSDSLKLAFRCMDDRNFDPVWVSETECLNVLKKDPTRIFVCDPFSGKVFDHLVQTQSRVVGPQCILKCLSTNQPIPRLPNPLYSTAMKTVILTCTNMDRNQKEYIERKIQLLGGIVSKVLVPSVTHLITNDVGSKKYFVAGNLGIPLMLPSWIDECWEHSKTEDFNCNDVQLLNAHRCPIFKGCSITVSQISSVNRMKLSKLIQDHGGLYNGNLECHKTTHLVLNEPIGKKYASARRWKVHCITPQWIYDSIDKNYCVDWSLYAVDESTTYTSTSTPEKNPKQVPRISTDIAKLEYSRIEPVGGIVSNINETCMTEFELTMLRDSKISSEGSAHKSDASSSKTLKELDCLDLQQIKKLGLFLDGCRIYICGFFGTRLDKLQRIINFGGGTRFSQALESVTHVLVNSDWSGDVHKLFSHEPHIVDVWWLVDSCKQGKLLPETDYYKKNPLQAPIDTFSPINLKNKRLIESDKESISLTEKTTSADKSGGDATVMHAGMDDVLNQYLIPQNDANQVPENEENPNKEENELDKPDNGISSDIFVNLRFQIHPSFKDDELEFLSEVIENRGGLLVTEDKSCDYMVVPLTARGVKDATNQVVTSVWIEHCASEGALEPIDDNMLFKPLPEDVIELAPLRNCVVTLSVYTGTERDSLTELARALGAVCQEFFLRVPKGDALANTHLVIPESTGSKYDAAKRWNIQTVTKDWLFDAVKLKGKPDEQYYDVDNPQPNPLLVALPDPLPCSSTLEGGDTLDNEEKKGETLIQPVEMAESRSTPMMRRKSRVETLKELSIGRKSSDRRLSSISGTPAKYLDLSAMSAAFDSPTVEEEKKPVKRRDSNQTFQADCKHYLKLALEEHADENAQIEDAAEDNMMANRPLSGITIVVSKKLTKTQGQLNNIAAALGADYRWSYDDSCTHLIYQGKPSDLSRDLRKAKAQGKFIVSPEWLTACEDEGVRVEETLYPYTFNPKMNLSSQITSKKQVLLQRAPTVSDASKGINQSTVKEPGNDLYQRLDFLMSTAKADSTKKRNCRADSSRRKVSETSPMLRLRAKISDENLTECAPPESQGIGPITWDDPTSRQEKEKIAEILAKQGTQESEPVSYPKEELPVLEMKMEECEPVDDEEDEAKEHDPRQRRFILTGLSDEEKAELSSSIQKLKGTVIDSESFDMTATHLIANRPSKTEKFFASIASGLWIVCPSYVEDSLKGRHFLPETEYEWGGEKLLANTSLPADVQKIAVSAHRWRKLLTNDDVGKRGAFDGWKVILNAGGSMKEGRLVRLLKAGCAKMLDVKPPYSDPADATHAFIENSKKNVVKVEWSSLVSRGILCLKMDYIASYLRDGDGVNPENFRVDDVLHLEKDTSEKKRKSDNDTTDTKSHTSLKRSRKQ